MDLSGAPKRAEPNKKTYACPFDGCTSVFDRPYRLAQHRLVHANVKPFICLEPKCEKAYSSKSHLDRHAKTAHKEPEENLLYCCPKCMKKYVNRQNLKRHIKVSHIDNNKPFSCGLCRVYFKKIHQLKAHMFVHNGVKPFRCPMCERDFVTLYEKKKHMRNHKVYECEHCDMKFTRWTEMMQHKRVDHVSPEYICHDCGKVFKERGHIIRHVKKHMPNTPVTVFFCPYDNCLRHYSRNSNLKQHILVKHEGLTFDCSLCGAKLSTKAKLNEHIDRHNRPELPVKVHKTLETGRKKRKDAGTIRYETAMRLAGIVKQKIEDGISRLYTDSANYQDNFEIDATNAEVCYQNGDFQNESSNYFDPQKYKTILQEDVEREPDQSIEFKVEANYSNESINFQDKAENKSNELPETSQHIIENSISCRSNESIDFQSKAYQPINLIEILNRPSLKINHYEESTEIIQMNESISTEVKIGADDGNQPLYKGCEQQFEASNEHMNESEEAGTSNQPITGIPIKEEHNSEEQSDIHDNVDIQTNLQESRVPPPLPLNNAALSSLLQHYWKTVLNHQGV